MLLVRYTPEVTERASRSLPKEETSHVLCNRVSLAVLIATISPLLRVPSPSLLIPYTLPRPSYTLYPSSSSPFIPFLYLIPYQYLVPFFVLPIPHTLPLLLYTSFPSYTLLLTLYPHFPFLHVPYFLHRTLLHLTQFPMTEK